MNPCIKRVLMTSDTIGGVWTYVIELTKQLKKYNIEVILATMGPSPNQFQYKQLSNLSNVELFESNFKLEWMDDPWNDIEKSAEWLLNLESLTTPDIIHLNGYCHAAYQWKAPVLVVAHSCVCSWFDHVKKCSIPQSWKFYVSNVRYGLQQADLVVTPSKSTLQDLYKHYGEFAPSLVIYNGIDSHYTQNILKEPFIFTAGRLWDEAKNINAIASISQALYWPVFAAGDPKTNIYETEKLHIIGNKPHNEILEWMKRSTIFCLPALYEPFGLTALEAASCGCVLVLSNIDSFKEIWADTALYIEPNNHLELLHLLNQLIENPDIQKKYASRSIERSKEFTSNKCALMYLQLYNRLKMNNNCVTLKKCG